MKFNFLTSVLTETSQKPNEKKSKQIKLTYDDSNEKKVTDPAKDKSKILHHIPEENIYWIEEFG